MCRQNFDWQDLDQQDFDKDNAIWPACG